MILIHPSLSSHLLCHIRTIRRNYAKFLLNLDSKKISNIETMPHTKPKSILQNLSFASHPISDLRRLKGKDKSSLHAGNYAQSRNNVLTV